MTPLDLQAIRLHCHAWQVQWSFGLPVVRSDETGVTVEIRLGDHVNAVTVTTTDRAAVFAGLSREHARLSRAIDRRPRIPVEGVAGDGVWREKAVAG